MTCRRTASPSRADAHEASTRMLNLMYADCLSSAERHQIGTLNVREATCGNEFPAGAGEKAPANLKGEEPCALNSSRLHAESGLSNDTSKTLDSPLPPCGLWMPDAASGQAATGRRPDSEPGIDQGACPTSGSHPKNSDARERDLSVAPCAEPGQRPLNHGPAPLRLLKGGCEA